MENGTNPTSGRRRAGLRERLNLASALHALSPEMLERLLNLPDRLDASTGTISRELEQTTSRVTDALRGAVLERTNRTAGRMTRATRRQAPSRAASHAR